MSRRPFGPWADSTDISHGDFQTRHIPYNSGTYFELSPETKLGKMVMRSGYISPKPYVLPRDASLQKFVVSDQRGIGFVTNRWPQYGDQYKEYITNHYLKRSKLLGWVGDVYLLSNNQQTRNFDEAMRKLIQKSSSLFEGLAFSGELDKTKDMFVKRSNALVGHHNKVTRSLSKTIKLYDDRRSKLSQYASNLSDWWLEYRFGVKPLLDDMGELGEAVAAAVQDGIADVRINGFSSIEKVDSFRNRKAGLAGSAYAFGDLTEKYHEKLVDKVGGTFINTQLFDHLDPRFVFGIGMENVIPALWEVTPYSWLVDYFVNIQELLKALSWHQGYLDNRWYVRVREFGLDHSVLVYGTYLVSQTHGVQKVREFRFNRGPANWSEYRPMVTFQIPSYLQAANIFALATSRVNKPIKLVPKRLIPPVRSLIIKTLNKGK